MPGVFSGPAAGFGRGRYLDTALPCTGLSQLADDASGENRDFKAATDDQLLGILSARARLEARAAWERLMAMAEFIRLEKLGVLDPFSSATPDGAADGSPDPEGDLTARCLYTGSWKISVGECIMT